MSHDVRLPLRLFKQLDISIRRAREQRLFPQTSLEMIPHSLAKSQITAMQRPVFHAQGKCRASVTELQVSQAGIRRSNNSSISATDRQARVNMKKRLQVYRSSLS